MKSQIPLCIAHIMIGTALTLSNPTVVRAKDISLSFSSLSSNSGRLAWKLHLAPPKNKALHKAHPTIPTFNIKALQDIILISYLNGITYALDKTSGTIRWKAIGPEGYPTWHPLVIGNVVYLPAKNSTLEAREFHTGRVLWTTNLAPTLDSIHVYSVEEELLAITRRKRVTIDPKSGKIIQQESCRKAAPCSRPAMTVSSFAIERNENTFFSPGTSPGTPAIWEYQTPIKWMKAFGVAEDFLFIHGIGHKPASEKMRKQVVISNLRQQYSLIEAIDIHTGKRKWGKQYPGGLIFRPFLSLNDIIYGCGSNQICVHNFETGSVKARYIAPKTIRPVSRPVFARNLIYMSSYREIYGFDIASGAQLWDFKLQPPKQIEGAFDVIADMIFFRTGQDEMWAIHMPSKKRTIP